MEVIPSVEYCKISGYVNLRAREGGSENIKVIYILTLLVHYYLVLVFVISAA